MNDFTKEELEEIIYLIQDREYMHGEFGRCSLRDKVHFMIDNYCEHDFVTFLEDPNKEPFIEKCMECHFLRLTNE